MSIIFVGGTLEQSLNFFAFLVRLGGILIFFDFSAGGGEEEISVYILVDMLKTDLAISTS